VPSTTVKRLYLGSIESQLGPNTPFHGYVVTHADGIVLVDTGMEPSYSAGDVKLVLRPMVDALADHGLHPADVTRVVTTHLHWDHYGQNLVFPHAPFVVQQLELERARREEPAIAEYFDFAGARFELLTGDAEILPGLHILSTPGHTIGHQSVLVRGSRTELIVGDAAYTADIWDHPDDIVSGAGPLYDKLGLPVDWIRAKQVTSGDFAMWRESVERLRRLEDVDQRHFCHDRRITRSPAAVSHRRSE
jgi:N-acyl homoserine lactone hydrolase